MRKPRHPRKRCKHNRRSAAKPDPRNQYPFVIAEPAAHHAEEDGKRTRDDHQKRGNRKTDVPRLPDQTRRRKQSKHREQHHLHQPRRAVVETSESVVIDEFAVSHHHAGHINRHKAVAVKQFRTAERQKHHCNAEHIIQAVVFQINFIEQPDCEFAPHDAEHDSKSHFRQKIRNNFEIHPIIGLSSGVLHIRQSDRNQKDCKERRHRIVASGFKLKQRLKSAFQAHALGTQNGKHRSGVGGRDHRAEKQAPRERKILFRQLPAQKKVCKQTEKQRRQQHADTRQKPAEPDHAFYRRPFGIESAGKQNKRHRRTADHVGIIRIVKRNMPDSLLAGKHTDGKKHHQHRHVDPRRKFACTCTRQDQNSQYSQSLIKFHTIHLFLLLSIHWDGKKESRKMIL